MISVTCTKRTAFGAALRADDDAIEAICEKVGGDYDGHGMDVPGQDFSDGFRVDFFCDFPTHHAADEAIALMRGAGFEVGQ